MLIATTPGRDEDPTGEGFGHTRFEASFYSHAAHRMALGAEVAASRGESDARARTSADTPCAVPFRLTGPSIAVSQVEAPSRCRPRS